jgi:glutathione S-transferase
MSRRNFGSELIQGLELFRLEMARPQVNHDVKPLTLAVDFTYVRPEDNCLSNMASLEQAAGDASDFDSLGRRRPKRVAAATRRSSGDRSKDMITLYDHPRSGNCHKVRLFLSMLKLSYESVFVDVLAGLNHEAWFDQINPKQQIPVLIDDGFAIQDSQAILVYLARAYDDQWFPDHPRETSQIVEWLSFAAKEIANGLQASRLFFIADEGIDIDSAQDEGRRALATLDRHLSVRRWLCLDRPTIADVACFPYVGLAREGKLPLDAYPNVTAWIDRLVELPGYISMEGLPSSNLR